LLHYFSLDKIYIARALFVAVFTYFFSDLPTGLPVSELRKRAAEVVKDSIAAACESDHRTGALRCTDTHHLCRTCWEVTAWDIEGRTAPDPCLDRPGEPLCILMQREIPQELPSALAVYYREEVLQGYTAGLARRVCMDFGACVDSPWMGAAGHSYATANFLAEVQAFGSFFHETTVYLGGEHCSPSSACLCPTMRYISV
jgi:hypothetical protein